MKFYPPISQLISREALPSDIGLFGGANEAIEAVLDRLLNGIRFKDLIINQSAFGDVRFYSLAIIAEEFGFKLPGTDISFLFFPGAAGTGEANIPIAFEWRWVVKRYVNDFESALFSRSPRDFFDLLLKVVNITEAQFIHGIVTTFIGDPDPYVKLVQDIKTYLIDYKNGAVTLEDEGQEILAAVDDIVAKLNLLIADLQDPTPAFDSALDYIAEKFESIAETLDVDLDICQLAFETVTRDIQDAGEKLDNLLALFGSWFGGFGWDDVEELLVPQFSLTVTQLPVALEFPRKWLVPLNPDNTPTTADTDKSQLKFNAGSIKYSTQTGLTFDGENSFAFTKSMIGKTGLTLEIDDAKIDFSRTTNIAEADAAGYPVDFVGVYIKFIEVGLPEKWFAKQQPASGDPVTLGIVGRDLLIGTGGVSGEIGLEVLDAVSGKPQPAKTGPPPQKELEFVLGKKPDPGDTYPRKGFKLGFSSFDMKLRQNALLDCKIKGSLTVPKFDPPDKIGIELFLSGDGDFELTASVKPAHDFRIPDVFTFNATSLSVGKDDKRVYLRTSGDLDFSENNILKTLIKKPIHIEKLLIYSDGSMELEGGTIPLPESCSLKIGPAKIAITALHFGAHEQEHAGVLRKYRYFGFDGGVSVNPGGVDARGDGIKYYYTVDDNDALGFHSFLRIEGIGIALVIPGSASEESAALILKGYLALKDPVYEGSISFSLPKAKITGGGAMKYDTSYPAWIVDVNLELPKPLPLGSTSLGIYGFRGLFGLRYVAAKEAIVVPTPGAPLPEDASWGDYYRAKQDIKGVTYKKFITPQKTGGSKNPFSVGVGVGLCTQTDGGKTFSSQLFLLVSLPNLIMLEGRADILSKKRVSVDGDPPYYAYLALSPESIELGAGVNYLIPKATGAVLNLNAVMQAAFFFHNASAWYVNFGTKPKPITARIISMFDGYAYLMLSASGIETGAGVHFDFNKSYGPIHVAAHAYLDMWAYIAFERFQAGGGIALGGYVDIKVFKFGLYIELAATLTVEVPKPFYVAGSVEICVSVNLKVKKFEKCCTLEFKWEKNNDVDTTAVPAMTLPAESSAAVAVHMVSGSTYPVLFSNSAVPSQLLPLVPLDSYIDVKFTKPVDPSAVATVIGGYTSPPVGEYERMPPKYGSRIVEHAYSLDEVKIEIQDSGGNWHPYHPYKALAPDALLDDDVLAQLDDMPVGVWQKQDPGYSQIRFLALTPFSWMGDMRGYVPEEMGITAKTTYCVAREREEKCVQWTLPAHYASNTNYNLNDVLFRVDGDRMEALSLSHASLAPVSLAIGPSGSASFRFLEPTVRCRLTLFTTAPSITIHWQRRKPPSVDAGTGTAIVWPWTPPEFEDVGSPMVVSQAVPADLVVEHEDPAQPIERIVLETPVPDIRAIADLEEQIALANEDWIRGDPIQRRSDEAKIAELRKQLQTEHDKTCVVDHGTSAYDYAKEIAALQSQLADIRKQIDAKQSTYNKSCVAQGGDTTDPTSNGTPSMSAEDCSKLAAEITAAQEQERALEDKIAAEQSRLADIRKEIDSKQNTYDASCVAPAPPPPAPTTSVPVPTASGTAAAAPASLTRTAPRVLAPVRPGATPVAIAPPPAPPPAAVTADASPAPTSPALSDQTGCVGAIAELINRIIAAINAALNPPMSAEDCRKLAAEIAALQEQARALESRIDALNKEAASAAETAKFPPGWECGTFVHEICWLSVTDYAFNQNIPGIAAIEADFSTMRAACEGVIAPIWQPRETYRITLTVTDKVSFPLGHTESQFPQHYYVHFRTDGPIGYFSAMPATDLPPAGSGNDDGRTEAPESALKFYIDMDKSYPDPGGKLLYAKPIYYHDVALRLFFNYPHAYHFFADWPDTGAGVRRYALELAVKDPAEAAPAPATAPTAPDYETPFVSAPLLGAQSWVVDPAPGIAEEFKAIRAFQNPLPSGSEHSTACLTIGGDPITPLSKSLKVVMNNLEPDKLYTAVILNRSLDESLVAEVGRYPFKTSHYPDFATHIASLRLKDDAQNERLAVFSLDHNLASANDEDAALAAALATVDRTPTTDTLTYADSFDRLIYGQLKLLPPPSPISLEFNFMTNETTGRTYGLWVISREPLIDPRLPEGLIVSALRLLEVGVVRQDVHVLFSKDCCQAFVMFSDGNFPTQSLSLEFTNQTWDGHAYIPETVASETFAKP